MLRIAPALRAPHRFSFQPICIAKRPFSTVNIPTFKISNKERDAFIDAVKPFSQSPFTHYQDLIRPLGRIFQQTMNPDLCHELTKTVKEQKRHGFFLRNCPVNPNPGPTPDDDRHWPAKGFIEEFFLLGSCALQQSRPFHDRQERHGDVFPQIITLKGHEEESSSRGLNFPWHTEHIHLERTIDSIDLLCVKGDPNAVTEVLSVEGLIQGLPDWVVKGMQQPIFEMQTGPSWPSLKIKRIQPILERNQNGDFMLRFNSDFKHRLLGINDYALRVLEHLTNHLSHVETYKVSLTPGDCLSVNNRRAAHQRTLFKPSTSHEDRRWLVGLYKQQGEA
jgi:hypothetical protein